MTIGLVLGITASVFYTSNSPGTTAINPLAVRYFEQTDTDKDLRISQSEFLDAIASRGTVSQDLDGYELALRSGTATLLTTKVTGEVLNRENLLNRCFAAIAEVGKSQNAREFYALDRDRDNMLSLAEFSKSERIPALDDLLSEFSLKDVNGDRLLDRGEAGESLERWLANNASPENELTKPNYQPMPEACVPPGGSKSVGKLYSKFEQLKRRVDIMSADGKSANDGLSNVRFSRLDKNEDKHLSFHEFLEWYL